MRPRRQYTGSEPICYPRPQNCSESAAAAARAHRRGRRAAGRSVDSVTLLAVSKGQAAAAIDSAARRRASSTSARTTCRRACPRSRRSRGRELTWHFIGQLQANKTRAVAEHFAWVHGVDRLQIAERLSEQRPFHAPPLNVCLQVNVGGEATKGGVAAAELPALARAVARCPGCALRGLMCMPPAGERRRPASGAGSRDRARSSTT